MTFNDVIDAFLLQKRYQVKESTYAHYCYFVRTHVRPHLGALAPEEINARTLEEFVDSKLRRGGAVNGAELSPKSVKDILTLVKAIIRYGMELEMIPQSSVDRVRSPKVVRRHAEVLSEEECARIERTAAKGRAMELGIYLSLYTGMRLGELCALRWEDIDIDDSTIYINHSISRIPNTESEGARTKIIIDAPKTDCSIRQIPLTPRLCELLAKHKPEDDGAYFLTGDHKYIEPRNYYEKYKNFLLRCGISPHTFHALRHTFATRCIERGFDAKVLSEILGHADVKITLDRYVHPSLERKRECMKLL